MGDRRIIQTHCLDPKTSSPKARGRLTMQQMVVREFSALVRVSSPCMCLCMSWNSMRSLSPPLSLIFLAAPSLSLVLLFPLPVFDTRIADWPDRKLLEGTLNGESIEKALGLDSAMKTMQRYIDSAHIDLIRKIQVLFWDVLRHLACMFRACMHADFCRRMDPNLIFATCLYQPTCVAHVCSPCVCERGILVSLAPFPIRLRAFANIWIFNCSPHNTHAYRRQKMSDGDSKLDLRRASRCTFKNPKSGG